ncbi:hypothetical protein S83_044120 [Arachis hypogaea]
MTQHLKTGIFNDSSGTFNLMQFGCAPPFFYLSYTQMEGLSLPFLVLLLLASPCPLLDLKQIEVKLE